ncbi:MULTISPECIES: branched-chain amino acid transport system II carrier protein [unclassified Clostridium]|uniref:Branched-chain amino acid transport system carrier protein n=1 Tax=Clostridium botulinum (strain Eklund 17B / Type B) TaxID=935198 RepID=B2TL83_CLOBB|nr:MULTISPECIES: branched-chain amino acid transport system II carrier protein [unclassified Clostridium]ACD23479.1 branched-chain amino acid transport system II carrier protein [Clostridium botulinum B str. Eklund 17B (NRP)]MBN1044395.1 branched-chain amino acid transport system II carrier protein [Clostridium botulinum]MBY6976601.1 branched-chain amino acid transport system II carrier protein [Clostridium botulinum]MBY7001466.1 branched-chain amino acid transport system II carrier protein [Cl
MKNLSKKNLILVSFMLFSMFFGAGNLIFPPFLGQSAGTQTWIALLGFFITAVGFPILGVIAVAKCGGLKNLASRVNPSFAIIFTILIYLSIGPCLGIPRAGSLPFEMAVAPFLPKEFSITLSRLIYTFAFFSIAYWLCLSPGKLVDRIGKFLTPTLLGLISIVFIGSLFKPLGGYGVASGEYLSSPLAKGFLEGYMTMDTIAALNFGIVIAFAIKSKGIDDEKGVISTSIKAGIISGLMLIVIYSMLAHLGAASGGMFGATETGAETLTIVMTYLFGKPGVILLAVIFTVACLTTCVGLITSCSEYFTTLNSKVNYKTWVGILTLSSMILANMGLSKILAVSVPVLNAIYPISIMLILLGILNNFFGGSSIVYTLTLLFTGIVSIVDAVSQAGITVDILVNIFSKLPLYSQGLGWILPAICGMGLGLVCKLLKSKFRKRGLVVQDI